MQGRRVHVIGAGIAGLAAAVRLARQGAHVRLYEAAQNAGGCCRSYVDAELGCRVDNGNHLVVSGNDAAMAYVAETGAAATFIARDMADWIRQQYEKDPITGLVATASDAHQLAERVSGGRPYLRLRVLVRGELHKPPYHQALHRSVDRRFVRIRRCRLTPCRLDQGVDNLLKSRACIVPRVLVDRSGCTVRFDRDTARCQA